MSPLCARYAPADSTSRSPESTPVLDLPGQGRREPHAAVLRRGEVIDEERLAADEAPDQRDEHRLQAARTSRPCGPR